MVARDARKKTRRRGMDGWTAIIDEREACLCVWTTIQELPPFIDREQVSSLAQKAVSCNTAQAKQRQLTHLKKYGQGQEEGRQGCQDGGRR